MLFEPAEKFVQGVFASLSQVMLEEVCDVHQKVCGDLPCTVRVEQGEVVGVRVDCKLRVCEAECWASLD